MPLTPIPAGELVHATGRLLRRGRDLGHAAASMRRATRARLGRRLGMNGAREELLPVVARATSLEGEHVERILGPSVPATDEELVRLGSLLADVEARAKGGRS